MARIFGEKGKYGKYSLAEQQELGAKVKEFKQQYLSELEALKDKTHYDYKRKRHVPDQPEQGYVTAAVHSFYSNLKNSKSDSQEMKNACKLAKRCYEKLEQGNFEDGASSKKYRAPEVREALFEWFVDVRTRLKVRLPKFLFQLKAKGFYEDWLQQNPGTPDEEKIQFSNQWIQGWETEYGVSLRKPNKRYSISKEDYIIRVQDYLKNIWSLRYYFIKTFGVDLPIINGDQMPLHRNESSGQATLSFKNKEVFIKENHHLSRERVTVFTQIATDGAVDLHPEFVFKGTGLRPPKLTTLSNIHYQWAPKGSYRLEQLLETIKHLPNRFNIFSHANFAIYVLDNYAVHLMPEVRKALWDRGYILVIIGGGITGFVQVNETHLHKKLKSECRIKELALMLEKLTKDPKKVPAPDRGEMMSLLVESEKAVELDANTAFKSVWVTNFLNGSEDYLANDKIFALVGDSMRQFRNEMTAKPPPKTIKEVICSLIPPKGIKRGKNTEGSELLDGDEIAEEEEEELQALTGDISIEVVTEKETQECKAVTGNSVSLVVISESDQINKDGKFFDAIKKAFDEHETSVQFIAARNQLENAYKSARTSLKKRIRNEQN